jgi:membrane protease YdiL (CAAX protease family)
MRSIRSIRDSEVLRRAEADELERARKRLKTSKRASSKATTRGTGGAGSSDGMTAAITFFVGACIATFLFFENPYLNPFEAYQLVNCAVLFWVPYLVITLAMKQDVQAFGLSRGDRKTGLRFSLIAMLVMLPVLIFASLQPEFREHYFGLLGQPLAVVGYAVRQGWTPAVRPLGVLYYEMGQGFYMFCWEFFFRGFLLFGLARARWIGNVGAIVLQAIPFTLLHWSLVPSASKPPLEIASAFVGGIILGWLAIRTKTFFYGFLIHWYISAALDLLLVGSLLAHAR